MAIPARRRPAGLVLVLVTLLAVCCRWHVFVALPQGSRSFTPARLEKESASQFTGTSLPSTSGRADANVARRIFGLGTSEILVILAAAALFFGPEALKGFAKEAGKAAGDLKDVPKAFQEGMDAKEGDKALETKATEPKSLGSLSMAMAPQLASSGVALPGYSNLTFRELPASDVPKAAALETASYPADEAATPEKLEHRQREAPELFYGVYEKEALVGFVVSTAAHGDTLEEEAMSVHAVGGESICIHSVVVDAAYRGRGVARAMVKAYVDAVSKDTKRCGTARRMLLIAHAPLLKLYAQCGFEFLGPSAVVHGSELWYDMRLDLVARRQLDFVQVDAFTRTALAGNPAAVLFTHRGGDEDWMQAVTIENNLSETAFVEQRTAGGADAWDIRWFTPGGEVALCGHATLGAAHALWDTGRVPGSSPIAFHTRQAGVLNCSQSSGWIRMDFPAQPATTLESESERYCIGFDKLVPALGIKREDVLYIGRGPDTTPDWLLEVTPKAFASLAPDIGAIARVQPMERGVIVTCAGGKLHGSGTEDPPKKKPRVLGHNGSVASDAFDFMSRFFAPALGVDEDPVTGSAHCVLACYWSKKLGKVNQTMTALQASARGGILRIRFNEASGRIDIEGQAVTVIKGRMAV